MAKKRFTHEENKILTNIYRRLNYFLGGDLDGNLLYLGLPSDAKIIAKYNLIKPSYRPEIPRILNWYKLTDAGKQFFANYVTKYKLDEDTNLAIFEGIYVKTFDFELLEEINLELPNK